MTGCLSCRVVSGHAEVSVVMDIQPVVRGHMLIVPRRHAAYLAGQATGRGVGSRDDARSAVPQHSLGRARCDRGFRHLRPCVPPGRLAGPTRLRHRSGQDDERARRRGAARAPPPHRAYGHLAREGSRESLHHEPVHREYDEHDSETCGHLVADSCRRSIPESNRKSRPEVQLARRRNVRRGGRSNRKRRRLHTRTRRSSSWSARRT